MMGMWLIFTLIKEYDMVIKYAALKLMLPV